jgi:alpha-beta hydrolase superfamily lysophospholipase
MLKLAALLSLLTYGEWFFRTYEREAIYPFDARYANPANAGIAGMRETHFRADDGTDLILWERDADPGRPVILYLPGNAGNLLGRAGRFHELAGRGYGFVALSWRGQGGSGGKPDEALLSADGLMVYDRIAGLDPVIYGESLGTAVAVKIAAQRVARGLVLESPFTSIPDLASVQYPGEDIRRLITQIWDSAGLIGEVDEPLLVLHGSADRLVPIAQGEAIFAGARSTDKAMLRIEGQDHTGLWTAEGQKALYGFLDRF